MDLENSILIPAIALIAIFIFCLILTIGWRFLLNKRIQFPVFGWLGIITGIVGGTIIALAFNGSSYFIEYFNIVIGCSIFGIYGAHNLLKSTDADTFDVKITQWNPYLTPMIALGGGYAGFIYTFSSANSFFNTMSGILLGILIVYFTFDIAVTRRRVPGFTSKLFHDNIFYRDNDPYYRRYLNSISFYIFIISVYYFIEISKNPSEAPVHPIFGYYGLLCVIGLGTLGCLIWHFRNSILQLLNIALISIICILPGWVLFISLN